MSNNVPLNSPTTPVVKTARSDDIGDGFQRQVVRLDYGGPSAEIEVTASTPLPVSSTPITPFTFRSVINTTQTNGVLVAAPGVAWRLTSLHIICARNTGTPDYASILIGINASVTPTGSQCVYSHPGMMPTFYDKVEVCDIAQGAATDKLLITTGTIASDVFHIFGTGYLL